MLHNYLEGHNFNSSQFMKFTLILVLGLVLNSSVRAQLAEPVQWSFKAEKISTTEYKVTLTATMDEGWYVYSQDLSGKGPVATRINFDPSKNIVFEGKPLELGNKKEVFDQNFNMTVTKLLGKTTYEQMIKLNGNEKSTVKGKLLYMTCNGQMCMPPKNIDFNIPLIP